MSLKRRGCPDGKPVPKSGRCPETPPLCEPGPNEQRNAQGQCVCKSGFERDKNGRCVAPPNPEDDCEEKGWNWTGTRCVEPPSPETPTLCTPGPNERRNEQGQCVCKSGFERDKNGRCVAPPNPEDECEDRGWIWNDRTDRCLPPPNPEDECEARGWVWNDRLSVARVQSIPPTNAGRRVGTGMTGAACRPPTRPTNAGRRAGLGRQARCPAEAASRVRMDDALPPPNPPTMGRRAGMAEALPAPPSLQPRVGGGRQALPLLERQAQKK